MDLRALRALADSYESTADTTPGLAGHAAQNAADKLRTAIAAATEADTLLAGLVNGDGDEPEPEPLAAVA